MARQFWCVLAVAAAGIAFPQSAQAQDADKTERLDAEVVLAEALKTARADEKKVLVHLGAPS